MMLTGSEIICECLIEQGVDTVLVIREELFLTSMMHFIVIKIKLIMF